jgi:HEPN domain-containing protein
VDRPYWQQLAEDRLEDARILLDAGRWSAAYYLCGYAVECALKACILAFLEQTPEVIFQDKRFSEKCWTHDIEALVAAARLTAVRDAEADAAVNPALGQSWLAVKDWSEQDRYQQKTEPAARKLYEAVADQTNGVLQWVRNHW